MLGLLFGACGDDGGGVHVISTIAADSPAYGSVPFPTDAVRDGDHLGIIGGLDAIARGHADLIARHVAALDGFGLRPAIEFFIAGGALDATTLPAATTALGDGVFVLDTELGTVVPFDWRYDPDRNVVSGSPQHGTELREGTRYAAVLTTDVHPLTRLAPVEAVADRWQSTADAYAAFDPEVRARIAGLAVFTTGHPSKPLLAAREVMATLPKPTLVFDRPALVFDTPAKLQKLLGDATRETTGPRAGLEHWGTDDPNGIARDHLGVVATGRFSIARFRSDDTATDGPEDETFHLDASGTPQLIAMETIPLTIVLPNTAMPQAGYPVVIFAHGLGSSRTAMMNLAEPLAAQGYATVAIDIWDHGSRYQDSDAGNNFGGKSGFTGDKTLIDGFGDDPGYAAYLDFFENFLNVAAIRDSIRQSALDFSRVATLIQDPTLDLSLLAAGGATPKLDHARVAYLGESFGTIVGTDVAAIEPSIGLFVLDVPGGGLLDQIMTASPQVGSLAIPIVQQIYRTDGALDRFHPLLALMQAVFDGGDPLTFAPHVMHDRFAVAGTVLPPRDVIAIEVIGDEVMANPGTTALAHALGLQMLVPYYDTLEGFQPVASPASGNVDGQTGVLVQYAPATHGYNWSAEHGKLDYMPGFPQAAGDPYPKLPASVRIAEPIYPTLAQVTAALTAYHATGLTVVTSTLAPVHDFDGDGKPDATDPDPLDPTK